MRKTVLRFFTIADYEEEEIWLREQHKSGWRMVDMTPPCFYVFEECAPQDVIYRLDYRNDGQSEEFLQMAKDFGWEYFAQCMGWLYFRKPAQDADAQGEDELLSDSASRADMADHVIRTRFVPLACLFLCCVVPNLLRAVGGKMSAFSGVFGAVFGILFVIYVYLIVHCGAKLKHIRDK